VVDVEVGDGAEAAEPYRRDVVGPGRLFLRSCDGRENTLESTCSTLFAKHLKKKQYTLF
jgi:hypothetical protein